VRGAALGLALAAAGGLLLLLLLPRAPPPPAAASAAAPGATDDGAAAGPGAHAAGAAGTAQPALDVQRAARPQPERADARAAAAAPDVRGRVHDARTLQPVPRFTVAIKVAVPGRGQVRSTREVADAGGRFTLTGLPAPPAYVEVAAPCYHELRREGAQLPSGEELTFALEPIRRIVLVVQETRGTSLQGARVTFAVAGDEAPPPAARRLARGPALPDREAEGGPDHELRLVIEDAPACRMRLQVDHGPDRRAEAFVDFARLDAGEHRVPVTLPPGLPRGRLVVGFAEVAHGQWLRTGVRLSLPRLTDALEALARQTAPDAADWPIAMPRSLRKRTAAVEVEVLTPQLRRVARGAWAAGEDARRAPAGRARPHPLPIVTLDVPRMDLLVKVTAGTFEWTHRVAEADFVEVHDRQLASVWLLWLPDR
jgi:hypothetical protein